MTTPHDFYDLRTKLLETIRSGTTPHRFLVAQISLTLIDIQMGPYESAILQPVIDVLRIACDQASLAAINAKGTKLPSLPLTTVPVPPMPPRMAGVPMTLVVSNPVSATNATTAPVATTNATTPPVAATNATTPPVAARSPVEATSPSPPVDEGQLEGLRKAKKAKVDALVAIYQAELEKDE